MAFVFPRFPRISFLFLAYLGLAACSATDVVNSLTPDDGYRVDADIAYAPDERHRLDIYIPDYPREGAPLIVFFYGGGWDSGSRSDYTFIGQAFAAEGYTVAIPDYRLYPEVRWRGFMSDAAQAVAYLGERFPEIAQGERGLVLAGHSAGAYIAAMLALDDTWLEEAGANPCQVQSVIGLAGPYDFLPLGSRTLREIFGPGEATDETQPITHVDAGDPPMLLVIGSNDVIVLPRNTTALAARLREAGVTVEERRYEDVSHAQIVGAMSVPFRSLAPTHDDVFRFLTNATPVSGTRCGT